MSTLPVNAICSGIQADGQWAGTPALIIRLMEHPDSTAPPIADLPAGALPEWELQASNEVSLNKLLTKQGSSPHFAYVGASTLAMLANSYSGQHVVIAGREPGRHDIEPLVRRFLAVGRSVQVEAAGGVALVTAGAWVTLRTISSRSAVVVLPAMVTRANEVLASIAVRADLDRVEMLFGKRNIPVWLRPALSAETSVYRQCIAVASRYGGWRVTRPVRQPMLAEV